MMQHHYIEINALAQLWVKPGEPAFGKLANDTTDYAAQVVLSVGVQKYVDGCSIESINCVRVT